MPYKLSLPMQLIIVLGFVIALGSFIPASYMQFFYSLSLTLKECLGFLLPFMVFSFICAGIMSFKQNAPIIIAILLTAVFASNILIPLISYGVCTNILSFLTSNIAMQEVTTQTLYPLWTIKLPRVMNPEYAIAWALLLGITNSYINSTAIESFVLTIKKYIEWIIAHLFIPVLPLYVLGFLLDIHYKGVFVQLAQSYGKTFLCIIALQFLCMFLIYFIASSFNLKKTYQYITTAAPSYLTAFGAMSSSAAIPVTIKTAQKNTQNKALAEVATPILANIHLFGDAITVPILMIVSMYLFNGTIISLSLFAKFVMYFCFTMLAASGVPGGGMIIIIPILKSVIGCSDAMISAMITLHLLQDGFGTGANVMGDGALMIIINKILKRCKIAS